MTTTSERPQVDAPALPVPPPVTRGLYERRRLHAVRRSDWLAMVGAAVAALCTTVLLFEVLTSLSSTVGFVLVAYVSFLVAYALLVSLDESGPVVADRLVRVIVWTIALFLLAVLASIVVYVVTKGVPALKHVNFYTEDMTLAGPLDGLDVGGVKHAIIGTLWQISIALVITVPLGLTCAVFLTEFPGRLARFVRTIVEAMTALPSIVAGLFIYASWILVLGFEKSGLAAALALSVMMLPIIIRASDVVLRLVPANLREASYALGTSRWRTVWHIVLPTARSGLTTAVILGAARGIGETSPVLLTAGFTATLNSNPTEGPQVSLPLAVYTFVSSGIPAMIQRGYGAATVLLLIVLLLFLVARVVGGRPPGQDTAGGRRRRRRASGRDARRFAARASAFVLAASLAALAVVAPAKPAHAEDYVTILGAGSTWSQNALDQWRRNVTQYGMTINYQGSGSSDGRNQFRNRTADFAVSEVPYGLTEGGVTEPAPDRGFAYMPIVAGGTAFMYNLKIGGRRVTNLRLSGETIAGIFTGKIKMWNDPKVKADNPELALPARAVVPVVRSDGSGTTAQFATWLNSQHHAAWDRFCHCGITSEFPIPDGASRFVAQPLSLGVSGYVKQEQNEGTITYVEYSYALNSDFPVAKVRNRSNYYVEPTAEAVAVALLKAEINPDLTQKLSGVYTAADKRAYPLSSYSYMILPTETDSSFTTDKGKTLGDFAYYFLCEGQQQAKTLGYSPLPINLVKAGLTQVRRIPGADVQRIDIKKCNNPTFSANGTNTLATKAPMPPACDKVGPVQCATGTGGAEAPTAPSDPPGSDDHPAKPGTTTPGTTTPGTSTGQPGTNAPGAGVPGATAVDPETGEVLPLDGTSSGMVVTGEAVTLSAGQTERSDTMLMYLAGLALLLVVLVPPVVGQALQSRGGRR